MTMHQKSTAAPSLDRAPLRLVSGAATHEYNLVGDADSYKFSHAGAYPGGMTRALSYVEDRVGAKFPASLAFGFQYYLKRYYAGAIVTAEKIDAAERRMRWHGEPFARAKWDHIVGAHGGRLPLRIRAVPEGTLVPVGNALRTIESTCPDCAWLPSFLETAMLRDWAPRAVATQGFYAKLLIAEGLRKSSDNAAACLPFALHDFGSRGTTCPEQAGICGLAHLVNWMGTDTCEALEYAEAFYGATEGTAYSVPALEHSTVLAWGKGRSLDEALGRQAECFTHAAIKWAEAGYKIGSFIADTYDVRRTIREQLCGSLYGLVTSLHAEHGFRVGARQSQIPEQRRGAQVESRIAIPAGLMGESRRTEGLARSGRTGHQQNTVRAADQAAERRGHVRRHAEF
jgi:nicotinamide phosphoribosyltransferase